MASRWFRIGPELSRLGQCRSRPAVVWGASLFQRLDEEEAIVRGELDALREKVAAGQERLARLTIAAGPATSASTPPASRPGTTRPANAASSGRSRRPPVGTSAPEPRFPPVSGRASHAVCETPPVNTSNEIGRTPLLRWGSALEYATLGRNVVGIVVLAFAAVAARSVALAGFGPDTLIEIGASTVVIRELSGAGEDRPSSTDTVQPTPSRSPSRSVSPVQPVGIVRPLRVAECYVWLCSREATALVHEFGSHRRGSVFDSRGSPVNGRQRRALTRVLSCSRWRVLRWGRSSWRGG